MGLRANHGHTPLGAWFGRRDGYFYGRSREARPTRVRGNHGQNVKRASGPRMGLSCWMKLYLSCEAPAKASPRWPWPRI
eukprot:2522602-Karenia_brevis.AAC.1